MVTSEGAACFASTGICFEVMLFVPDYALSVHVTSSDAMTYHR